MEVEFDGDSSASSSGEEVPSDFDGEEFEEEEEYSEEDSEDEPLPPKRNPGPPSQERPVIVVNREKGAGVDEDFFGSIANPRKIHAQQLEENANLQPSTKAEDDAQYAEHMNRVRRLRRDAQREEAQDVPESAVPVRIRASTPHVPGGHQGPQGPPAMYADEDDDEDDLDDDLDDDFAGARDAMGADPMPQKTRAELEHEARKKKTQRIVRIQQLEGKGLETQLPPPTETPWMSLPLSTLDDEWWRMECIDARRKKILRMRWGLFMVNKGLVKAATDHPGPDWLKFNAVRGFDKKVAEEIHDFDDPLERLYDLWFDQSGEMHPLLEILVLEASMLGNYIMLGKEERPTPAPAPAPAALPSQPANNNSSGLMSSIMEMFKQVPNQTPPQPPAPAPAPAPTPVRPVPAPTLAPTAPPKQTLFDLPNYGPPPNNVELELERAQVMDVQSQIDSLAQKNRDLEKYVVEAERAEQSTQPQPQPQIDNETARQLIDKLIDEEDDGTESDMPTDGPLKIKLAEKKKRGNRF